MPTALLTLADTARLLGISPYSVRALLDAGQLETRAIPGRVNRRITLASVERFLAPQGPPEPVEPRGADEVRQQCAADVAAFRARRAQRATG
jgi:hypothetical protein